MRHRLRTLSWILILGGLMAGPASGQSLYNAAGLGLPLDGLDAGSRALGNVGIGLMGGRVLPSDPAAAAQLGVPGAVFTAQPSWVELGRTDTGESGSFRATRFPLLGIAYPAWSLGMATLTFSSVLDQRYEGSRTATVELEDGPVTVTDDFTSTGGLSEVRLGLARSLNPSVQVGVSAGRYTGSTLRALVRSLDGVALPGTGSNFREGSVWEYSGTSLTGGAAVSVGQIARVAGSVTWSSDLHADVQSGEGRDRDFAFPLQLHVGGAALLAPGLMVNASLRQASWSDIADDLENGGARDVVSYGAGIELSRARLFGRQAPLRFGYRSADLPFAIDGGEASESAWTGGVGLELSGTGPLVLAGLDLAVERGERREAGIAETFWRGSLTLRVSGL